MKKTSFDSPKMLELGPKCTLGLFTFVEDEGRKHSFERM